MARKRLSPDLLRELLSRLGSQTDQSLGEKSHWKGRRLFAADGTPRTVRRSAELWVHFGAASGSHHPQASVCAISNVLTGVTDDLRSGPYGGDERSVLLDMLGTLGEGDVLLLDRGDPSYEILRTLVERGIEFVVRMPRRMSWPEFGQFVESVDRAAHLLLPLERGAEPRRALVRAVKRGRPGGEDQLLLSNLPSDIASDSELEELYAMRWAIEETYKLAKGDYLGQRQMHVKSAQGVEQDLFALQALGAPLRGPPPATHHATLTPEHDAVALAPLVLDDQPVHTTGGSRRPLRDESLGVAPGSGGATVGSVYALAPNRNLRPKT